MLGAVLAWATARHASQRRTFDNAPFIVHPLEVASMLSARGYEDDVVAAGLLHDVVEQADASLADVRERFGERVADLVAAVTEDDGIADYDARKAALRERMAAAGPQAHAIYAADKIAKVRELRAQSDAHRGVRPAAARALRAEPRRARLGCAGAADGRPAGVRAVGASRLRAGIDPTSPDDAVQLSSAAGILGIGRGREDGEWA